MQRLHLQLRLQTWLEGRTNQEIADQLVLSIKTVQAHRANVMEKLGMHDITKLVRFAVRHGLIPLAEDDN